LEGNRQWCELLAKRLPGLPPPDEVGVAVVAGEVTGNRRTGESQREARVDAAAPGETGGKAGETEGVEIAATGGRP